MKCYFCKSESAERYAIVNNNTGKGANVCNTCEYMDKEYCGKCQDLVKSELLLPDDTEKKICKNCFVDQHPKCYNCDVYSICKCSCNKHFCQSCSVTHFLTLFTNIHHYFEGRV